MISLRIQLFLKIALSSTNRGILHTLKSSVQYRKIFINQNINIRDKGIVFEVFRKVFGDILNVLMPSTHRV